ncbi:hypothetical protein ACFVZR_07790 [Streptomyces sp. NPDC058316]
MTAEGVHPSLVHRLARPVPAELIRAYLAGLRQKTAPVPETFQGPNYKES